MGSYVRAYARTYQTIHTRKLTLDYIYDAYSVSLKPTESPSSIPAYSKIGYHLSMLKKDGIIKSMGKGVYERISNNESATSPVAPAATPPASETASSPC